MENNHVISALRRKRAELPGFIPEAERRLASLREAATSIDITLRLFDPDAKPEDIKPKRTYKRRTGFARRELPRPLGRVWEGDRGRRSHRKASVGHAESDA